MLGPLSRLLSALWGLLLLGGALPWGLPRPDLVLSLLIPAALRGGAAAGALFGFLGGLSLGLLVGGEPGVLAGLYGCLGAGVGATSGWLSGLLPALCWLGLAQLLFTWVAAWALPDGGTLMARLPGTLAADLLWGVPASLLAGWCLGPRAFRKGGLRL